MILHNFLIILSENEALAVLLDEPRWQTACESSIVTYKAVCNIQVQRVDRSLLLFERKNSSSNKLPSFFRK